MWFSYAHLPTKDVLIITITSFVNSYDNTPYITFQDSKVLSSGFLLIEKKFKNILTKQLTQVTSYIRGEVIREF
jgi:hypothetical protein